ncbi:MAG: GAF domain-containing protein [Chloroflexi bacterium]|nr:GAF domain-containing protein [Chloroflexota bacterium]
MTASSVLLPSNDRDGAAPQRAARSELIRLDRLRLLFETAARLSREHEVDRLVPVIARAICDVLRAERSAVYLVDHSRRQIWSKVTRGDGLQELRFPIDRGFAGHAAVTGDTLNVRDCAGEPRFDAGPDGQSAVETGSDCRTMLVGPVRNAAGRIIGVTQAVNKLDARGVPAVDGVWFDKEDEQLLSLLNEQAAVALNGAFLWEENQKRVQRTALLLDVMRALTSQLELEPLLDMIVTKTSQALRCDRSTLWLVDNVKQEIWSKVAQGVGGFVLRMPMHLGLAGHVATTGDNLNIPEAYDDPRFNQSFDKQTGYRTKSMIVRAIRDEENRIIGVFQCINKLDAQRRTGEHAVPFSDDDEELLDALASQAAVALQNARLFENVIYMKNYNESILRSMATGVITMDLSGHIFTINPAALRIFHLAGANDEVSVEEAEAGDAETLAMLQGAAPGDSGQGDALVQKIMTGRAASYVGLPLSQVLGGGPGGPNEVVTVHLDEAIAEQKEYTAWDVKLTMGEDESVNTNLHLLPLTDRKGTTMGFVLVVDDITQEQKMMSTLSRYVSREIAEQVLSQKGNLLGGQIKSVTVLMSDIRSYTTLTENSTAEEIVSLLNDYFSRMVEAVFEYEGTVDKFIGDALMAVFGAPVAHDDDPLRCVLSAMEMRRKLRVFNAERRARGEIEIEIGIGVCSGHACSGNIGSMERMDFTVIGDAVNVSARLEGETKNFPAKILMSDTVYEAVKDHVPCVSYGEIQVKGRKQPVRIYGIMDDAIFRPSNGSLEQADRLLQEALVG